ncbi:hypothetical protein COCON_G00010680 [Conger conger]|uniref:Transposase Tc1-like domain-containing protein n=1 Tax=Conger conger TaxID=82655 RepID=A0A9Q1E2K1_CONCO|nr:hypothetical protein COCON_G00010680 [Conger conger]
MCNKPNERCVYSVFWLLHLGSCCLNMRAKEVSMAVKQTIIKLKNEKKSIRDIAETVGVSKSTVWHIVKKQERTGELSNGKRSGRPRKTTVVDDEKILSIVKKKPFSTAEQIKNTLQNVGVDVSTTTIKRRLHQHNFRWFTTRCKPLDNMTSHPPDQSGMSLLQEQVRREIFQRMQSRCKPLDMTSHSPDQSGMSLLQEQVRREILQRMQTRFSSIIDSETMDLEELLNIARQELAVATATSSHVNIPEELVCSLQELICRLDQSMQCKPLDNMTSHSQDLSGMSLLQEQVRREILQKMQTRFSSIIDSETMDLEDLLNIAQQELALATATSTHMNIPEELYAIRLGYVGQATLQRYAI